MRTVSFSHAPLRRLLDSQFVCSWRNIEGDPNAGASFAHDPESNPGFCTRGNGNHNIQFLIMTPDERLVHAVSGFISGTDLQKELNWARETWKQVSRKPTEEEQRVALAEAHRARAEEIRASSPVDAALHRTGVLERAGLSRTTRQLEGIFGQKGIPDPTAMMSQIMKKRSVSDHEFMEQNALQPYDEFQLEELVGRGTSFFGTTNGSQPGGFIGK